MGTMIIAEAGVNHNGSLEIAKELVDAAKDSGADCIKFQTYITENIVTNYAMKADYQKAQSNYSDSQLEMLKNLELSFQDFIELKHYCVKKNIEFLSTAFDSESIKFLDTLGARIWKIPSGEITNLPYLVQIAKLKKSVILSTGMSTMDEIKNAIQILKENGTIDISILHCTTEYPTPYCDVNLNAMNNIKKAFGLDVGYSDHTAGIEVPIAAVALGATIIEKHFTLDRNLEGPDHQASLEPNELKSMVTAIRHIELAMGDGIKQPAISEKKNILIARKSIVAFRNISAGEIFTDENLTVKRPGNGISPMRWLEILGKRAVRNFQKDEMIEL